jgi:hypothetical protein
MPPTQQREKHGDIDKRGQAALQARLGEQVMHVLGQPANLLKVHVAKLWDNHYRVNVFVGRDAASAKIANSYFLVLASDGFIKTSHPKITSQY